MGTHVSEKLAISILRVEQRSYALVVYKTRKTSIDNTALLPLRKQNHWIHKKQEHCFLKNRTPIKSIKLGLPICPYKRDYYWLCIKWYCYWSYKKPETNLFRKNDVPIVVFPWVLLCFCVCLTLQRCRLVHCILVAYLQVCRPVWSETWRIVVIGTGLILVVDWLKHYFMKPCV